MNKLSLTAQFCKENSPIYSRQSYRRFSRRRTDFFSK